MNIVVPFTKNTENDEDHSLSLAVLREKQFNAISKKSISLKVHTQEISNSATFLKKDNDLVSKSPEKSRILLNSVSAELNQEDI